MKALTLAQMEALRDAAWKTRCESQERHLQHKELDSALEKLEDGIRGRKSHRARQSRKRADAQGEQQ